MVKHYKTEHKQLIADSTALAEKTTMAEIVTVVTPASDAYQGYVLLYGFIAGSLAAFLFWWFRLLQDFPLLLMVQVMMLALVTITPALRRACLHFVPRRNLRHRAAHRAFEEYLMAAHRLPSSAPLVLFYISMAERYAHIIPSRLVRENIDTAQWDEVIKLYTSSVRSKGLEQATGDAIAHIAALLAPHFPVKTN